MQTKSLLTLGGIIFLLGVTLGLALAITAIWGDYEGFAYFNSGAGYSSFDGLACPILMTHSEKNVVTANFNNPDSESVEPYYEVAISGLVATRSIEGQLTVPAHAAKSIQWTVGADDIVLGHFILVDVQILPMAGYSTRETTCGIFVLDLTGPSGGQVFAFTLAGSLAGILLGLILLEYAARAKMNRYSNLYRALRTQGILVLLAMLTGILGWWAIGLVFSVLAILLLVISLRLSLES